MDHVIATEWLGCDHVVALSPEQFRDAGLAKDLLIAGLKLEESYDVFILNFASFEEAIASSTIKKVVYRGQNRHQLEEFRRDLDRHLVNLLASGEMYSAHAETLLKMASRRGWQIDPKPATVKRVALETNLPGFHAMKWLRNAVLHQALPISSWGFNSSWTDDKSGPGARIRHSFSASFAPSALHSIRDIPPTVRDSITARADEKGRIQWRPLVREYVEGISQLHEAMRESLLLGEDVASALLREMVAQYRAPFGGDRPLSVVAVHRGTDGNWLESFSLDFEYEERIGPLRKRNRKLLNLSKLEIIS